MKFISLAVFLDVVYELTVFLDVVFEGFGQNSV